MQFWIPTGCQTELRNFWREGWFPSRIAQFLEGVTQPVVGSSLVKQPVRGMQQALMDRFSFCKKITEACVLDKKRHVDVKAW